MSEMWINVAGHPKTNGVVLPESHRQQIRLEQSHRPSALQMGEVVKVLTNCRNGCFRRSAESRDVTWQDRSNWLFSIISVLERVDPRDGSPKEKRAGPEQKKEAVGGGKKERQTYRHTGKILEYPVQRYKTAETKRWRLRGEQALMRSWEQSHRCKNNLPCRVRGYWSNLKEPNSQWPPRVTCWQQRSTLGWTIPNSSWTISHSYLTWQ